MVPLANMFGYVNNLRSMSQGRAQFTMQFDHYAQAPQGVAEEVQGEVRLKAPAARKAAREKSFVFVLKDGEPTWLRKNSSGRSRIATSGPSVTSITARRR